MSEDHDPLAETRQFQPIDPYNIGPDTAGAPLPEPGYADGDASEYGSGQGTPERGGLRRRLRGLGAPKLAALGAAGVLLVGGVAWGATALASSKSSSSQPRVQEQLPEDAGASSAGGGKRAKIGAKNGAQAARVTITKLDAGSFTGTDARGNPVTVVYGGDTKFGTKVRPLSPDQLQAGMVVRVAGTRSGDKITALLIAVAVKKAEASASPTP
ncbi:MAG: hypothetical protein HOV87_35025 [Catenulispora sp.]|nr:hypothetical protein [Catenulispora sp.]